MSDDLVTMPDSFSAGSTLTFLYAPAGYDPAEWTLTVYLAGASVASAVATAEAGAFRVTFDAATTAGLEAGGYEWLARAVKAGVKVDLERGVVLVVADLATANPGDYQAWAEKTLAVVEQQISGRLPKDQEQYQIAGRAVTRIPIEDLIRLRTTLQNEVRQLRNPDTIGRSIKVYFPAG